MNMTIPESDRAKRQAAWDAYVEAGKQHDATTDAVDAFVDAHQQPGDTYMVLGPLEQEKLAELKKARAKAVAKLGKARLHTKKLLGDNCFTALVLILEKHDQGQSLPPKEYAKYEKLVDAFPDVPG